MIRKRTNKDIFITLVARLVLFAGLYFGVSALWPDLIEHTLFLPIALVITMISVVFRGDFDTNRRPEQMLLKEGEKLILIYGENKTMMPIAQVESVAIDENYLGIIEKNNGNGYDIMCKGSQEQIYHHLKNILGTHIENCKVQLL
ncbi:MULTISPECIES: hypothetical protein [unclassified Pseudoalteromonas]|uniref:hypothetical protein n=1 Tax=unclassified Pseudoalteromonas TaxID=194690 RepID=UPI000C7C35F6|nr:MULTISPECIES: hypothetical protein [unclassified Pseudoalteromonas]AUJ68595.1 hypothetical protein PNC201_01250 [Pseudoalteromonas sp. NC201]MCF7515742.1 hypothetical protein [Pseudoalteromonas sp. L7]MCF7527784.1 hypothetical protein [Pseudoalteromonas sp. L23]MCX2768659.1 hypothetical protein [Pseudoalteromonas sp. B530]